MSTYAVYDLSESMRAVPADFVPARVLEAWGTPPEDYAEWSGGFLLESVDGRYGDLSGWCDTSGWGCQDGADFKEYAQRPGHAEMLGELESWESRPADVDWDQEPADLNKWIAGGMRDSDKW